MLVPLFVIKPSEVLCVSLFSPKKDKIRGLGRWRRGEFSDGTPTLSASCIGSGVAPQKEDLDIRETLKRTEAPH